MTSWHRWDDTSHLTGAVAKKVQLFCDLGGCSLGLTTLHTAIYMGLYMGSYGIILDCSNPIEKSRESACPNLPNTSWGSYGVIIISWVIIISFEFSRDSLTSSSVAGCWWVLCILKPGKLHCCTDDPFLGLGWIKTNWAVRNNPCWLMIRWGIILPNVLGLW